MIWRIAFISLVFLDGFLTQKLLALGATELNPNPIVLWSVENLWARILIAITIIVILQFFRKEKLLIPLTFVCLGICVWNGINLITSHAALFAISLIGAP
jgi:hypothetical protein